MNIKPTSLAALVLSSLAVCASAYADPIPLTNNGATDNFTTATAPANGVITSLGTLTLVGSASGTFSSTAPLGLSSTFTATYNESVYKDSTNPFGAGDLIFEETFSNSPGSADAIEKATNGYLSGFSNFSVSVGYMGSADAPFTADETNGTVDFNFTGATYAVKNGASSDTLIIFTNATAFQPGVFSLIDSQTFTEAGFVPTVVSATPEPSSLILLGTGILGVAGAARRKYMKR